MHIPDRSRRVFVFPCGPRHIPRDALHTSTYPTSVVASIPLHCPNFVPFHICCEQLPSQHSSPIFTETLQVEHETSVIGTKTITVILLFVTGLAYFTLRHRISQAFG